MSPMADNTITRDGIGSLLSHGVSVIDTHSSEASTYKKEKKYSGTYFVCNQFNTDHQSFASHIPNNFKLISHFS